MTRRAVLVAVCIVTLATLVGGCGVGAQSNPQVIDRAEVPFGLAQRDRSAPTTAPQVGVSYTLFFVAGDRLRAVTRSTPTSLGPAATLRQVVRRPDRAETEAGLRTLLPPDLEIDGVTIERGTATVALGGSGAAKSATDQQVLGIAQLVFTATGLAGVDRVRFEVDGEPAEIPRGDGTLSTRPVDRADYPAVAP